MMSTESTKDMLTGYVERTAETIREYAQQIEDGEYGNRWTVTHDETGNEWSIIASNEDDAIEKAIPLVGGVVKDDDLTAERDAFDEPTIIDESGNESPIYEWPLAIEVKIGRPLAVVVGTGGPHLEIVQDLSDGSAKLAGYWGGERVYNYGSEFQTVLDYLTDSLYDEAPEEYK